MIDGFDGDDRAVGDMPIIELCDECFILKLQTMQSSSYSVMSWSEFYQDLWARAVNVCNISGASWDAPDPVLPGEDLGPPFCLSNNYYTTVPGDTCDTIALANNVPSAGIVLGNLGLFAEMNCTHLTPGTKVCLPSGCTVYQLRPEDDCRSIRIRTGVWHLEEMNSWLSHDCSNLHDNTLALGSILCLTPPGGLYEDQPVEDASDMGRFDPSISREVAPLPDGAVLAAGTSLYCGGWSVAEESDDCTSFLTRNNIDLDELLNTNPSLGVSFASCSAGLTAGTAYCVRWYEPRRPQIVVSRLGLLAKPG